LPAVSPVKVKGQGHYNQDLQNVEGQGHKNHVLHKVEDQRDPKSYLKQIRKTVALKTLLYTQLSFLSYFFNKDW
jgi:hypothetical protein